MHKARETEQHKRSPPESGDFFYARSSQAGCHPSLCGGAAAARSRPPGSAAGFGFSGRAARRLGGAVWGTHPLRAGADARLCGGLLRCLCGRGSAGAAAPWVRGAVAGQHLSALRHRGRRSGTVALAGSVPARPAGGLRGPGAGGRLLCLRPHRRRGRPAAHLRGRCPAGGGAGLCPAAVPARNARRGDAACRGRCRCGPGRGRTGAGLPWRRVLRGAGSRPLLPGPGESRPCLLCRAGCSTLRGGCLPRPGGSRALLRQCSGCSAGPRTPGGSLCRLCRRLCDGGALRPAARQCLWLCLQRRGGAGAGRAAARRLAGPGARRRTGRTGGAAPFFGGGHPAGSGS